MTSLHCREELRVEDGAWVARAGSDELMVVFASGPILPDILPTAEFLRRLLDGRESLREPEHVLEALHRCASDEQLLSAVAASWRDGALEIAWLGEVRGHLIRGARLVASTRDHTLANEPAITDHGDNGIALARIVTRTLGGPGARPDTQSWCLRPGDALLLCAAHLHDFRPPARYLDEALDFTRPLPGRLLIQHQVEEPEQMGFRAPLFSSGRFSPGR
jgi:hypothetical protein